MIKKFFFILYISLYGVKNYPEGVLYYVKNPCCSNKYILFCSTAPSIVGGYTPKNSDITLYKQLSPINLFYTGYIVCCDNVFINFIGDNVELFGTIMLCNNLSSLYCCNIPKGKILDVNIYSNLNFHFIDFTKKVIPLVNLILIQCKNGYMKVLIRFKHVQNGNLKANMKIYKLSALNLHTHFEECGIIVIEN